MSTELEQVVASNLLVMTQMQSALQSVSAELAELKAAVLPRLNPGDEWLTHSKLVSHPLATAQNFPKSASQVTHWIRAGVLRPLDEDGSGHYRGEGGRREFHLQRTLEAVASWKALSAAERRAYGVTA